MERISSAGATVRPASVQPPLPLDRVIVEGVPSEDSVPMDVVFVGGGPAGLAGAIELSRLVQQDAERGGGVGPIEIGVLEKAAALGEHSLSGAVLNPAPFLELFPDVALEDLPFRGPVGAEAVYRLGSRSKIRLPVPPTMSNHGNHIASICEVVRWMGERAEELGVNVFPGYPVESLLVSDGTVRGVRTAASGLGRDGSPGAAYAPGMDVSARVTVLSEGTRGLLTQSWMKWEGVSSANPQIYAVGVKELWSVARPLDRVIHTLGWPLPPDAFGGSWIYPMADDLVSLGLVVGLDYTDARLDVHDLVQRFKSHPLVRSILEGGEVVEWGAKTIPEGGFYSIPTRRHGNGICIVGDACGLVDVASLKGIHYAVQSGILAARSIFGALESDDTSAEGLASYSRSLDDSFIMADLRKNRNMRLAFKSGFATGAAKAGLMTLTGGRVPGRRIEITEDAEVPREPGRVSDDPPVSLAPNALSKVDAVFLSGNRTRDDIPSHLLVPDRVAPEMAGFYSKMCPAGVYELRDGQLVVNPANCIDCKATDVLGPRWAPREGGSGPAYRRM